jgi:hypothetical protein
MSAFVSALLSLRSPTSISENERSTIAEEKIDMFLHKQGLGADKRPDIGNRSAYRRFLISAFAPPRWPTVPSSH